MESRAERVVDDLAQENYVALLRACDVVFGSTCILLAVFGVWLLAMGRAEPMTVAALWFIPVFNLVWSALRFRKPIVRDVLRAAISLPVTTYLYVAESGVLQHLWLPALMVMLGVTMSQGIVSRRPVIGYVVTMAYSLSMFIAAAAKSGSVEFLNLRNVSGLVITGLVVSMVASRLGRSLAEAQHQRDDARDQKERAEIVARELEHRTAELTSALVSVHDGIRQRDRMEIELRQAQKLESVGRLAAGVAHEINTPVQFIQNNLQFVRDAMTDVFELVDRLVAVQRAVTDGASSAVAIAAATESADAADLPYLRENIPTALASATDGLDRVATIVRSMKEFAHPEAKEMAAADINRAIESTLAIACNEYKYVAELETDLGEIPPVCCQLGELNQAVLNIVINAAHAVGDAVAGTRRKGRIHVRTYRDGDDVVIAIADTGTGIPDLVRERIFDPFFTTKEVGVGTGQGLAIARSVVVDKHGGQLQVETEIGKGTTFFIRLPILGRDYVSVAA